MAVFLLRTYETSFKEHRRRSDLLALYNIVDADDPGGNEFLARREQQHAENPWSLPYTMLDLDFDHREQAFFDVAELLILSNLTTGANVRLGARLPDLDSDSDTNTHEAVAELAGSLFDSKQLLHAAIHHQGSDMWLPALLRANADTGMVNLGLVDGT